MVALLVTLLFGISQLAMGGSSAVTTKTCGVTTGKHSHAYHCRTYRNGVRVPNERVGPRPGGPAKPPELQTPNR
jgi:hypothetical protein